MHALNAILHCVASSLGLHSEYILMDIPNAPDKEKIILGIFSLFSEKKGHFSMYSLQFWLKLILLFIKEVEASHLNYSH